MQYTKWLFLSSLAAALLFSSAATAQLEVSDGGAKEIVVSGAFQFLSEAPVETIEGTAINATGTIATDTSDLSKTSGTISVPVATMKTGNKKRDKHLASKDWLDAKAHPQIEFEISSVTVGKVDNTGEAKVAELQATGNFSLHGVTKELTIPLTVKWKGNAIKVAAEFSVALADFDVEGAKGIVGDRVGTSIQLTANLTGAVR